MSKRFRKHLRRWLRYSLIVLAVAALLVVSFVLVTWPNVASLAHENPETTAFIEQARSRGTDIEWRWASADAISMDLKKAVLVAEDLSFFKHKGFDTYEIRIAAREAVRGTRVRGASTITQQLAKNLWLSPSRSPTRKFRELVLTRQLENHLSKQRLSLIHISEPTRPTT